MAMNKKGTSLAFDLVFGYLRKRRYHFLFLLEFVCSVYNKALHMITFVQYT